MTTAELLREAIARGRDELAKDGKVDERTWTMIDGLLDTLDVGLAALEERDAVEAWRRGSR